MLSSMQTTGSESNKPESFPDEGASDDARLLQFYEN